MEFIQLLGRFHPLVLHLPIGFLILAFIMESMSRTEKYKVLQPAVGFSLKLGMWSAIIASISGYILSLEGDYNELLLSRHQWLGIATAVISILVYILYKRKNKRLYFSSFAVLILLLLITGHFGGNLTHGSDFLFAPFSEEDDESQTSFENIEDALVFDDFIKPILKSKCVSCHNESKLKGDLLLTSQKGIETGGKNGALFVAGKADESLMFKRIHLPINQKKHMPPKGKKQLTKNEIILLEWWVNEQGSFDKSVADLNRTKEIDNILKSYVTIKKDVFALKVDPPKSRHITELQDAGVKINYIAKDLPFLSANLNGRQDLDKSLFKKLKKIAQQLIYLDLGESNLNDQLATQLEHFPHLQKLFLYKTEISGNALTSLQDMKYLEYLNLYDTKVDDKGLEPILQLTSLQNIYLWNTNVSKEAVEKLANEQPKLNVNTGISDVDFGSSQLKAPLIIADKDIFHDTLQVEFKTNFKKANLYYTLDGSIPDSNALKYSGPFTIDQTTDIRIIAQKEGWETSELAQKLFVRAKYKPVNIKLNKQPNKKYAAKGAKSLIDFKKGTKVFGEGSWLGFEKEHITAFINLGEKVEVSRVTLSALEDTNSWIFFPKGMNISLSNDGKRFHSVSTASYPTTKEPTPPEIKNFSESFNPQKAQFIKVEIKSNLINPKWHPGAGKPCWFFIDEILIE